jgi:hypothetical protein
MSYPTFTHSSAGTLTLSRGESYPLVVQRHPRQRVGTSDAGTVQVLQLGVPSVQHTLEFAGLPQSDADALAAFLDAINYAAGVITYDDCDGASHAVRVLDHDLTCTSVGVWTARLVLLEEPA